MIIRSGLHGQRMEKRPSAFLSDDGGAFTAIAAGSIETVRHSRWRGKWLGHGEFAHMGIFGHPGPFAPQSLVAPASVLRASQVDERCACSD
jgi:hypothetical protein